MKGLTLPSAAWKPTQSLRPPDSSLSETLGELSSPFFLPLKARAGASSAFETEPLATRSTILRSKQCLLRLA